MLRSALSDSHKASHSPRTSPLISSSPHVQSSPLQSSPLPVASPRPPEPATPPPIPHAMLAATPVRLAHDATPPTAKPKLATPTPSPAAAPIVTATTAPSVVAATPAGGGVSGAPTAQAATSAAATTAPVSGVSGGGGGGGGGSGVGYYSNALVNLSLSSPPLTQASGFNHHGSTTGGLYVRPSCLRSRLPSSCSLTTSSSCVCGCVWLCMSLFVPGTIRLRQAPQPRDTAWDRWTCPRTCTPCPALVRGSVA